MKITNKQLTPKRFDQLEQGTVFQNGNRFFMKTERIETGDFTCNAIDLMHGNLVTMFDNAAVILVDCELVIK